MPAEVRAQLAGRGDEAPLAELDDDLLGRAVEVAGRAERVAARVDVRQRVTVARDGGVADLVHDRVAGGTHEPLVLVAALERRERPVDSVGTDDRPVAAQLAAEVDARRAVA